MGKKLAIKGHPTRGKEVTELLEMMGGINWMGSVGDTVNAAHYYNISESKAISIDYIGSDEIDKYATFTLEKFLEKYPFKVGDKVIYTKFGDNCDDYPVTIESMKWTGTTIKYTFNDCVTCLAKDLKMWNSNDNHAKPSKMKNVLAELLEHIKTTPKEELEKEFNELEEWSNVGPTVEEFMDFCNKVYKKPEYPKTYKECCEKINACPIVIVSYDSDEDMLYNDEVDLILLTLRKLLICRGAYWKIAGEEMGLDKPWDSTYGCREWGYWIGYDINANKIYCQDSRILLNHLLVFPTEEIRDTFYENFKDLIEACKELL